MIPASFEYFAPASIQEALALLSTYRDDVKILAGGQSLVPLMKLRLAKPKYVVDLSRIADLNYVRADGGSIFIGALATHSQLEHSQLLQRDCPLLSQTPCNSFWVPSTPANRYLTGSPTMFIS